MVLRAYKYRLYPTEEQKEFFEGQFGACRYVYNWALEQKIHMYKKVGMNLSIYTLQKSLSQVQKKQHPWLKEYNAVSLIFSLRNLDAAYKRFFKEKKGFPKFKSKRKPTQSFQFHQNYSVDFKTGYVKMPKVGNVECRFHRTFEGKLKTATVSRNPAGQYYISILVDDGLEPPEPVDYREEDVLGIDVGLSHFAITSNGEKIENPRHLRNSLKRLQTLQRRVSRKKKGSNNRRKAVNKLARLHLKIKNQREDFQHNLSRRLIDENQAVAVEDLNIQGMQKNHCLAQAVSDVGWYGFIQKLAYKAKWSGKTFIQIDRWFPSSKTCNQCGLLSGLDMDLSVREWICPHCGTHHDRDINAANNIKRQGYTVAHTG